MYLHKYRHELHYYDWHSRTIEIQILQDEEERQ